MVAFWADAVEAAVRMAREAMANLAGSFIGFDWDGCGILKCGCGESRVFAKKIHLCFCPTVLGKGMFIRDSNYFGAEWGQRDFYGTRTAND